MSGDLSFIWGQNEDCSPGDSTSDSSEKLCSKEAGGEGMHVILVKGDCMLSSIYFPRRILLVL